MNSNELTLTVEDKGVTSQIAGWESIRVTRGIERVPCDFSLTMSERRPGAAAVIVKPGQKCTVDIGSDRVITGYADRFYNSITSGTHTISVTGRGKCQDLTDCSAVWQGGQFENMNVLQVAQKVAAPFGIKVTCAAPGEPLAPINLIPGESPLSIIAKQCQIRGLLAYEGADGNLILSRTGKRKAAGGIALGVNVEAATLSLTMDQRFSEYVVINQGALAVQELKIGPDVFAFKDPLVPRLRPKYLLVENQDAEYVVAKAKAQWEMNRRLGRAHVLSVTVSSWRDSAGRLWEPNTLCHLSLDRLGVVDKTWLIGEVTYQRDSSGTHAQLTLMPPQAFDVQPVLYQPIYLDIGAALK